MADHDGAAEETESVDAAEDIDGQDVDAEDAEDVADVDTEKPERQWFSGARGVIAAAAAAIVALVGLAGWLGYRVHNDHQAQAQRNLYVQVARQTAINLTTISYTEVDADVKRVLDSATGAFHDEFQNRSQPFVEVVQKMQSKTEGTIAEAGLLSSTKDQAQVLVAVAVKTSMAAAPADPEPRRWRMRLTVDKTGDSAKVSNVEFVP
ncbi:Mce protein [Mycobacterium sp.]|uniref:Mce protein n=1 Tax=Mycobacterium sp. TaxID=1785 RepID=UPI003D0CA79D